MRNRRPSVGGASGKDGDEGSKNIVTRFASESRVILSVPRLVEFGETRLTCMYRETPQLLPPTPPFLHLPASHLVRSLLRLEWSEQDCFHRLSVHVLLGHDGLWARYSPVRRRDCWSTADLARECPPPIVSSHL